MRSFQVGVKRSGNPTRTHIQSLGKMPAEFYRDSFFELLIKMESNEKSRVKGMERPAAAFGMTVSEYCTSKGYPVPQDHKTGNWKTLRDKLTELPSHK